MVRSRIREKKVDGWIQAHKDILHQIAQYRIAIQRTNLETRVPIEMDGGETIVHSISYWIQRRQELAQAEVQMWRGLTDRGIKEGEYGPQAGSRGIGGVQGQPTADPLKVTIIRFFDPSTRDTMINMLESEQYRINSKLEIVNAITDLIE